MSKHVVPSEKERSDIYVAVILDSIGRIGSADRALVSDQAASRLAPAGFDPLRVEGEYQ